MSKGQISFDLIMEDDMDFVEGCYCDTGEAAKVFVITKASCETPVFRAVQWPSGVTGVNIYVPHAQVLDRSSSLRLMTCFTGIADWQVVFGPDSITLR
jgi:hypothetical protein